MTDPAGTFKSPRFVLTLVVFAFSSVALWTGVLDQAAWQWVAGGSVAGYMGNNALKGLLARP